MSAEPFDISGHPAWDGQEPPEGEGVQIKIWPPAVDFTLLAGRDPAPPRFIVDDWLPAGYATLMAGHGGVGKSGIALHLAVCMALGRPFFGLAVSQRRVMYLSCEDRENVLHWRLARICAFEGVSIADLAGNLELVDLVGQDTVLYRTPRADRADATYAMGALMHRFAVAQHDVLFVDGISDTFGGNENDKIDVKQYVNSLIRLIDPNDGAVVLIGHVNKQTAGGDAGANEGYSGTTGWHNSVRARWYLYPETIKDDGNTVRTGTLSLDLQKSNLGVSDRSLKFNWDEVHHMFVGETVAPESQFDRTVRERQERAMVIGIISQICRNGGRVPSTTMGRRTTWHVISAHPDCPEALQNRGSVNRFNRMIEGMKHMAELVEQISRINGKDVRHIVPGSTAGQAV